MAREAAIEGRFGIKWAVGASLILHLLVLLVAWLFPGLTLVRSDPGEDIPEETVLNFDFAPVTETDRANASERRTMSVIASLFS